MWVRFPSPAPAPFVEQGTNEGSTVNITTKQVRALILCSIFATLTACGGGSGGGGLGRVPPPGGGTDWQPGVFLDANTFFAQCQAPRAGINPATGAAYLDVAGSTLDENNFLRSFSDEIYLWYNEIVDRDPSLYNDPLNYFDLLKTTATTPSGAAKDKFHFTYDTEEYFQLSQGGVSAGYGANWALLSTTPPREIVVAYSESNSAFVPGTVNWTFSTNTLPVIAGANSYPPVSSPFLPGAR